MAGLLFLVRKKWTGMAADIIWAGTGNSGKEGGHMAGNAGLTRAKEKKDDEFYTLPGSIEAEIGSHADYARHFKGKTVLCNCDNSEWSSFYVFFRQHFRQLGLKKVITTHFNRDGSPSYKLEWDGEMLGSDTVNMIRTPLDGDGDFRSEECVRLLKEADIVCTNPPFSIARESFIPLLFEHGKQFAIIGDLNWVTYKNVFPLIRDNKMWFGYTGVKEFKTPDGNTRKFGNKLWFTNLDLDKNHEELPLTKNYRGNERNYPRYDNYDAIEVRKVAEIPKDYYGMMGVPISFLSSYSPEQFEIMGMPTASSNEGSLNLGIDYSGHIGYRQDGTKTGRTGSTFGACPVFERNDGKSIYYTDGKRAVQAGSCERIFIRRRI